jgi:hypothetical protein
MHAFRSGVVDRSQPDGLDSVALGNKREPGESGPAGDEHGREEDRSGLALAGQWVSRIMTVSFEMVIPGLIGLAVDRRLGWKFPVLGLLGFGLGITAGIWHLAAMTGQSPRDRNGRQSGRLK